MIEDNILFENLTEDICSEIIGYVMCGEHGLQDFHSCLLVSKTWNTILNEKDYLYFQLANTQIKYEALINKYNRFWTDRQANNSSFWREFLPLMFEEQRSSEWIKIKEDLPFFDKDTLLQEWIEVLNRCKKNGTKPTREEMEQIAKKNAGEWTVITAFNQYADWVKPLLVSMWDSVEKQAEAALKILIYKHGYFVSLDRLFYGKTVSISRKDSKTYTVDQSPIAGEFDWFADAERILADIIRFSVQYNNTNSNSWTTHCSRALCWYFEWICFGVNKHQQVIEQMVNVRFGNGNAPTENQIIEIVRDLKTLITNALYKPIYRKNRQAREEYKNKFNEITHKLSVDLEACSINNNNKSNMYDDATLPFNKVIGIGAYWNNEQKQKLVEIVKKHVENQEIAEGISNRMTKHLIPDDILDSNTINEALLDDEIEWEKELLNEQKDIMKFDSTVSGITAS